MLLISRTILIAKEDLSFENIETSEAIGLLNVLLYVATKQ